MDAEERLLRWPGPQPPMSPCVGSRCDGELVLGQWQSSMVKVAPPHMSVMCGAAAREARLCWRAPAA